jgi:hypothetical protein
MKVVNVYDYGGREAAEAASVVYCGRPSPLGNPYSHMGNTLAKFRVKNRDEALDKYRRWLYHELTNGNKQVIEALENLKENDVLGCFCKPKACHCDIIIAAWKWWFNLGGKDGISTGT